MSVSINEYDLRDTFLLEKKLLLYVGFYPLQKQINKYFYVLMAIFNLFLSYGQLLTMVLSLYFDRNELLKLTATLLYFCTQFTFVFKLFIFQCNYSKMIEIENFLEDPIFYGFTLKQLDIIKNKMKGTNFIANYFRTCCSLTVTVYSVVPLIDESRKNTLPLPGWFPYDILKFYASTYIFQLLSIIISAYGNTAIDIITWKLLTLVSAQFEILKINLTQIDFEKSTPEVREAVIHCIKHHKKILGLTKLVQTNFSKGMFLQLFASCMVICTTGFQLLLVPFGGSQFTFAIAYLCGMTCQIATYCYYGHEVMTASDAIGESLYMSNWYMADLKIRKILITFLENVKKPTLIKAGNFVTMSLATFTQIMRSAYSYFAVLQRLYFKNNL